jgi:hypothetical protein
VGPTWFGFFIGFPKLVQLVKSKHVPYFTPKIPNFFVKLDWNIRNNFINCADFRFPTESMLKILEQIQNLNLL